MTKKKHPHKRAIPKEKRKEMREHNVAWWRQRDKERIRRVRTHA